MYQWLSMWPWFFYCSVSQLNWKNTFLSVVMYPWSLVNISTIIICLVHSFKQTYYTFLYFLMYQCLSSTDNHSLCLLKANQQQKPQVWYLLWFHYWIEKYFFIWSYVSMVNILTIIINLLGPFMFLMSFYQIPFKIEITFLWF